MNDGRAYIGAFPGRLAVHREGDTVRLVLWPFDAVVGQRWEVCLTAEDWGRWLLGQDVVRPIEVYQTVRHEACPLCHGHDHAYCAGPWAHQAIDDIEAIAQRDRDRRQRLGIEEG